MSECAFCDRKQFEERLIAEINGFNIIASLGQITDGGYVLLVPKSHVSCIAELSWKDTQFMLDAAFKVWQALSVEYGTGNVEFPVTAFEHGIVGQTVKHAHVHIIPQIIDMTARILNDFPHSDIEILEDAGQLQSRYEKRPRPYLFWTRHDGTPVVCWNPPAPPQYLRTVLAKRLGRPERANWRTMDSELDKKLWTETVRKLKPHF